MPQLSTMVYKVNRKLVSNYLSEIFTNVNEIHNYNTRQSQYNFTLPKPNTNFTENGFRGSMVWNRLPEKIKASESCEILRIKLSYLLTHC